MGQVIDGWVLAEELAIAAWGGDAAVHAKGAEDMCIATRNALYRLLQRGCVVRYRDAQEIATAVFYEHSQPTTRSR